LNPFTGAAIIFSKSLAFSIDKIAAKELTGPVKHGLCFTDAPAQGFRDLFVAKALKIAED
jgi:hypothetical protein